MGSLRQELAMPPQYLPQEEEDDDWGMDDDTTMLGSTPKVCLSPASPSCAPFSDVNPAQGLALEAISPECPTPSLSGAHQLSLSMQLPHIPGYPSSLGYSQAVRLQAMKGAEPPPDKPSSASEAPQNGAFSHQSSHTEVRPKSGTCNSLQHLAGDHEE